MRILRLLAATAAVLALSACGSGSSTPTSDPSTSATSASSSGSSASQSFPVTIEHALGTTVIEKKPERVATVSWANQEVPLALGVVPVGMQAATFGDDNGNGVLPWVESKLTELGAATPVLFDENDGIDFEAVADTKPDVILAAYSGLTAEDYATLSAIAPTVAYPKAAWSTSWKDMIRYNSMGMGMAAEGDKLIGELEQSIADTVAKYPAIQGKSVMFMTHVDTSDLSTVNFYTANDTRAAFFNDLGMVTPKAVEEASAAGEFAGKVSAEHADVFDDVDVIVTYGDQALVDTLKADPLLSQMPAVANNAIVFLDGAGPAGTAANPTPLSIGYVLDDYVAKLNGAAEKAAN